MQKKREQLHKILDLILDINGMEARKRKLTGEKPTAFFNYSGHTNTINAVVYKTGWRLQSEPEIDFNVVNIIVPIYKDPELEEIIAVLEGFKNEMNQETTECTQCGQEGIKEDMLQTVEGYTCEDCMKE